MRVLEAVQQVNEDQKSILFEKLSHHYNGNLEGRVVTLWGLAFKPETDDVREAPSLVLIDKLLGAGCKIKAYDPIAMESCRKVVGDKITYCRDMYEATVDSEAVMLITEWKEFRVPSLAALKATMRHPIILDGRNIYDREEMEEHGFTYYKIG